MNFLYKAVSFLFGGSPAAQTVIQAADKVVYTEQEKAGDVVEDLAMARAFAGISGQPGLVNQLVDAANRCVRPGVTFWLVGGFAGAWTLPDPGTIDPYWQSVLYLILTFWFGGRVLLKDLPAAVRALRGR